jgi:hypothetical protein
VQGRFWNVHWLCTRWRVSFYQWLVRVHHSDHNRDVDGNNNGNYNGHNVLANCHANVDSYRCPIDQPDCVSIGKPNRGTDSDPNSSAVYHPKRVAHSVSFSSTKCVPDSHTNSSTNINTYYHSDSCTNVANSSAKCIPVCNANCSTFCPTVCFTDFRAIYHTYCVAFGGTNCSTFSKSGRSTNRSSIVIADSIDSGANGLAIGHTECSSECDADCGAVYCTNHNTHGTNSGTKCCSDRVSNRDHHGNANSSTKRDSDGDSFGSAKRSANSDAHRCTQHVAKRITDRDANCCTVVEPDRITFSRSLGIPVCCTDWSTNRNSDWGTHTSTNRTDRHAHSISIG